MSSQHQKRLLWLALFTFGLFSLLIAQFFKIQILEGEKWSDVARRQHFFVVKEPFRRGTFYTNTPLRLGHPQDLQRIVVDIQKYHLYADPISIPKEYRSEIAEKLMAMIDLTTDEQLKFRDQFEKRSRSRKLAMWIGDDIRDQIHQWWRPYARERKIPRNALFFITDYQRSYPFGKLLGQVLHTVQHQKDEQTGQAKPTGGLELSLNHYLKGKLGKRLMMRSPRHSFETGKMVEKPENGADVYLTIDHYLQAIAEEEVEKGVKKCNAKRGWAVMMNPHNGEILALAQYPFFNPPDYKNYYQDPELIENTKVSAVTDAHEPGSHMKPITLAIALMANQELESRGEEPLFDPQEKIATSGGKFPGRQKELRDLRLHKYLNMEMGLQKSSNVYMATLVQRVIERLGPEWYRNVLHQVFGFGTPTRLELPAETWGVLPTPGKLHPNGKLEWSAPTPYSLAMGHNLQASSLQSLRAWAILVNGGKQIQPTLIHKVVKTDHKGREFLLNSPPFVPEQVLSPEICRRVVRAMKFVTKPGGTCRRADIYGYTEAGKSGTAEKIVNGRYSKKQHIVNFIGFTPVEDPAFLLFVGMDEPEYKYLPGIGKNHHGGVAAAPVFREIGRRSLEYLGIAPDDPHGYPKGDPRYDAEKADWVAEVQALKELYDEWNE